MINYAFLRKENKHSPRKGFFITVFKKHINLTASECFQCSFMLRKTLMPKYVITDLGLDSSLPYQRELKLLINI